MGKNKIIHSIRVPRILDATVTLIAEKGIQNITLDQVAERAELSKGGLVHYFSGKDKLIESAVTEFFKKIFKRGKEIRDKIDNPFEQILSYTWLYNKNEPDLLVGYRLFFDMMSIASQDRRYRQVFQDFVENWITLLKASISKGIAAGDFQVENIDETARSVSAVYQGVASRWFLDPENHPDEWAVKTVRNLVSFLMGNKY
ncbi:MAG: TetR/AcrR family transcriptional regulator [Acidobacteria bacterium]|nr:TetR/AcrR family transcriptional regulator [Acidobacteriota bacterium]